MSWISIEVRGTVIVKAFRPALGPRTEAASRKESDIKLWVRELDALRADPLLMPESSCIEERRIINMPLIKKLDYWCISLRGSFGQEGQHWFRAVGESFVSAELGLLDADGWEGLQDSDQGDLGLEDGEVLTDADSVAGAEWEEAEGGLLPRLHVVPPLRVEGHRVLPVGLPELVGDDLHSHLYSYFHWDLSEVVVFLDDSGRQICKGSVHSQGLLDQTVQVVAFLQ